jgi:hypothetical protein
VPTVTLRFSPLPEHVRTARLVAVSVARRAGFGDNQLDEIRIAIGEACSRAVAGGVPGTPRPRLVDMHLCDDEDRLDVTVVQCDEHGQPLPDTGPPLGEVDPLSLALMAGMADTADQTGTAAGVALSWRRHGVEPPGHLAH